MEWLSGWLRELILVVLLATFVDMLLPNRSMERYVKLVLSLLILLTLISPIFNLFNSDADAKLSAALDEWSGGGTVEQAMTLTEILERGRQLTEQQEVSAMKWAAEQVADQMKTQIEEETQIPIQSVTVQLGPVSDSGNASEKAGITGVEVILSDTYLTELSEDEELGSIDASEGTAEGKTEPIYIDPIQTSDISVELSEPIGKMEGQIPPGSSDHQEQALPVTAQNEVKQIEELLEQQWDVLPKKVQIVMPDREVGY
ncbi:stage III sporulation protein AF [Neobacillus mesonae]|nr:stage III sporulation protein AF [Neobacillus mesonae]